MAGLGGGQAAGRARGQHGVAQAEMKFPQARPDGQRERGRGTGRAQAGDIRLQRIGGRGHGFGAGEPRDQPLVQRLVVGAVGETVDLGGQFERGAVEPGSIQLLRAQTDLLEQGQPVVGSAGAAGRQPDAAIAAERPEHHAQAGADLVQRYGGFRVMLIAGAAADQPMPRLTDCFFRFEQGNHDASQPSVMSMTRSNALRMSGSSVSGSIMDARMARSMRIPAAIRVAQ